MTVLDITKNAGRRWAESHATDEELERLSRFSEFENAFDTSDPNAAFGAPERLVFYIRPDEICDRQAARSFWTDIGFEEVPDDKTAERFALGALEVLENS